jgi:hypothetical protein
MIYSIRVLLNIGAAQGKQVFILDIKNAFQNTIEFDYRKSTYNMLPPFFVEYLRLHWKDRPDLAAIEQYMSLYVVHNFCSMQG